MRGAGALSGPPAPPHRESLRGAVDDAPISDRLVELDDDLLEDGDLDAGDVAGARVVPFEQRHGDRARALVDIDMVEDVAGLDAAPEEDREGPVVVTDDHLVEDPRGDPGHPRCRLHLLAPVVRVRDLRIVTRTGGV